MPPRAAGFVIYRKLVNQYEYLLMQAAYGTHHWTPPKGHVDPGEDLLETAYRETFEEAGLSSQDLKIHKDIFMDLVYPVRGEQKTTTYWLAELINQSATVQLSDEHQAYKWLPLEPACDLARHEQLRKMFQHFDSVLNAKQ